jgi:hypothetical protein
VESTYRLARPLAARLVGAALVLLAALVMVGTVLAAATGVSAGTLLVLAGLAVAVVVLAGAWVARGWQVLHLDEDGYRLRWWRSSGVGSARWVDVTDAAASFAGTEPVVVLELRDGRRTVIPVRAVEVDSDELVRTLQRHLQDGHGITRL